MSTPTKLSETEAFKARKAEYEKKAKIEECLNILDAILIGLAIVFVLLGINWFIKDSINDYIDQRVTEEVIQWNN